MASNNNNLEKRLWSAADELRANSKLKSSENEELKMLNREAKELEERIAGNVVKLLEGITE